MRISVVAQAIVGLDWIELVVRGLVLVLCSPSSTVGIRRQDSYWATVFYLCMCLWCYYTFRGSTFYFAYHILYRFLPLLIRRHRPTRRAARHSRSEACGV